MLIAMKCPYATLAVVLLFIFIESAHGAEKTEAELVATRLSAMQRLYQDLFKNEHYDRLTRPVLDQSQSLEIQTGLYFNELLDMDPKAQILRIRVWAYQSWLNPFLVWDPSEYANITTITAKEEDIWIPDTYLYENVEMDPANAERPMPIYVRLQWNGTIQNSHARVMHTRSSIFKTNCKMDVFPFPWDIQKCFFTIGAWTSTAPEVSFKFQRSPDKTKLRIEASPEFLKSLEWSVPENGLIGNEYTNPYEFTNPVHGKYKDFYSTVKITLKLKRAPFFYVATLIFPAIIVVQINFLGMFTLSDSTGVRTEKVNLGITSILALSILLLVAGDLLPRASDPVPLFNSFLLYEIVLLSVGLVCTVLLIYVQYFGKSGRKLPWYLARMACMPVRSPEDSTLEGFTLLQHCVHQFLNKRIGSTAEKADFDPSDDDDDTEFHRQSPSVDVMNHGRNGETELKERLRLITESDTRLYARLLGCVRHINDMAAQAIMIFQEQEVADRNVKDWERFCLNVEKCFFLLFSALAWLGLGYYLVHANWKRLTGNTSQLETDLKHVAD